MDYKLTFFLLLRLCIHYLLLSASLQTITAKKHVFIHTEKTLN